MATLNDAFTDFLKRLSPSQGQIQQVSERTARFIELIQRNWKPMKIVPIGSHARGTSIPPLHDVDRMVVLNRTGPEEPAIDDLLRDLCAGLARDYPDVATRVQRRSVGLCFVDFGLDVVPVLERRQGGFRIPDVLAKRWIYTDPIKHEELVREKNRMTDGVAANLVKALKVWNVNKSIGLKSFHLEVMALRSLGQKPTSFAQGLRDVLLAISGAVGSSCGDPGLSGGQLDAYLDQAKRQAIAEHCRRAADEMGSALREDAGGRSSHAIDRVRRLLGSPF
ncbi:hypothetical protein WME75_01850 [Sorangium sp. So ce1014]|uniref:SMODS domain-containing nucleotidyltransferase n=1 Tax=Sorangium sp. So ce1014 TaxID=3133326 RepID=UPI003F5E77DF